MPPRPQSRIEVDLKLLKDKNVEKLQEFGVQFDRSIDKLATMLGTYSEQVTGAEGIARRAGRVSPDASVASNVVITGPGAHQLSGGGFNTSSASRPSDVHIPTPPGGQGGGASSTLPGGGLNYHMGGGGSFDPNSSKYVSAVEADFVGAQKRIGEHIPVGFRQMLGYAAEGQVKIPGVTQENAKKWNDQLFRMQAYKANMMLGFGKMQGAFASVAVPTQLGMDLGRSREGGLFGTGLFSSAWTTSLKENLKTGLSADFGFNPNYSMQQAAEARKTTQSFGYSGDTSDVINAQLKELQIHQNLAPAQVMSMLDPLMRYGNANQGGEQLINVLRSIPEAAKAAGFNLKVFTDQVIQTSVQIAQQTGMQPGQVASALSSFSTVTGLSPERAAGLFTPEKFTMAAATTGKTMTQIMEHPSAAPEMQFGYRIFKGMTGGLSGAQLNALRHSNPAKYNQLMDGVWRMYNQNHDIFGGQSPLEIINSQVRNRGRTVQHMAVDQKIRDATLGAGSVDHIESLIKGYGPHSSKLVDEFQHDRTEYLRKNPIKDAGDMAKYRAHMRDDALKILGANQKKQARRATVQITLSPEASRYFQILNKNTGQADTPGRNAMGSFWRKANDLNNNTIVRGIEDGMTGGTAELVRALF